MKSSAANGRHMQAEGHFCYFQTLFHMDLEGNSGILDKLIVHITEKETIK